jgi:hypothetical protein
VTETNVFQLSQPGTFSDPLTEVLAMPAIFGFREFAVAGGLMSYGGNIADSHIVILFEESELEIVECESAEAALATMLMGGRDVVMIFAMFDFPGPWMASIWPGRQRCAGLTST